MEVKKRMQLMFNVQNDTIINKIMGVFKTMINNILKPSNIIKVYRIFNKIRLFFNSLRVIKNINELIVKVHRIQENNIYLDNKIKELKKVNVSLKKDIDLNRCETLINVDCTRDLKKAHEFLTNVHNNLARDFSDYKFKANDNIKALELAITMAKNDNNNLQESFNEYVLRPKAEKMIKEVEDYSFESELEQQKKDNCLNDNGEWKKDNINDEEFIAKYLNIDIDKLVEDVYDVCNYGNYINKNDLKETITKHINLNN